MVRNVWIHALALWVVVGPSHAAMVRDDLPLSGDGDANDAVISSPGKAGAFIAPGPNLQAPNLQAPNLQAPKHQVTGEDPSGESSESSEDPPKGPPKDPTGPTDPEDPKNPAKPSWFANKPRNYWIKLIGGCVAAVVLFVVVGICLCCRSPSSEEGEIELASGSSSDELVGKA